MKKICRLFGHKIDPNFTDGGFHICERCQMHEYHNAKQVMINQYEIEQKYYFEDAGILLKPYFYLLRKYQTFKHAFKNKYYAIKSKYFLKDSDGLPF